MLLRIRCHPLRSEGIDVEVENAAIDEIAFVQVKAASDQRVLDDYIRRFQERRERYARMVFAVHSPRGVLKTPADQPIQIWDDAKVSELVVRLGLGDWVTKRIA